MSKKEWPLWEIFIRSQHGLAHKHVGSLHATDAEMALNNARDVYTRRNEGVSMWVVRASDVTEGFPTAEAESEGRSAAETAARKASKTEAAAT